MQFFDGLAWLMQIVMFLTDALEGTPGLEKLLVNADSHVFNPGTPGFPLTNYSNNRYRTCNLIFPYPGCQTLVVFLCFLSFKVAVKDQVFIFWVGIRGAVPIILATFPIAAGVSSANMIFNIVFFITITSALLQGSTINIFARYLGLSGSTTEE
ncbi:MAG: cation:proton antiporter [Methanobacterium sp.]